MKVQHKLILVRRLTKEHLERVVERQEDRLIMRINRHNRRERCHEEEEMCLEDVVGLCTHMDMQHILHHLRCIPLRYGMREVKEENKDRDVEE